MLTILAAVALLSAPYQEEAAIPTDGRGWAIRCAVVSHYAKGLAIAKADEARYNENAAEIAHYEAAAAQWESLHQAALAAPYDVAEGAERFGLARRFRAWVVLLDDNARDDELAACQIALMSRPGTAETR